MTSETNKQTLDLRRSEALLFGRSSTTAEEKRKKTDSESQMDNFPVMGIGKVSRMRTYKMKCQFEKRRTHRGTVGSRIFERKCTAFAEYKVSLTSASRLQISVPNSSV